MRYVRPPADRSSTQRDAGSLFPLGPSTHKLRVAVDVETLGEPTQEVMRVLARDEEVERLLLVQSEAPEPTLWMRALQVCHHSWSRNDEGNRSCGVLATAPRRSQEPGCLPAPNVTGLSVGLLADNDRRDMIRPGVSRGSVI